MKAKDFIEILEERIETSSPLDECYGDYNPVEIKNELLLLLIQEVRKR